METMTLYINGVLEHYLIQEELGTCIIDDLLVGLENDLVTLISLEYKTFGCDEHLFIEYKEPTASRTCTYSFKCNFTSEQIERISNIG